MTEENSSTPESNPPTSTPEPLQLPELTEVDMLSSRITELENTMAQLKDQLLRRAAEFENYKKRVENDSLNLVKFANEELILKLLPVLDDFERSLRTISPSGEESGDQKTFMKGIGLIYNKFKKILEANGVREFEVTGKKFDPQYHDALLQVRRDDVPPHTVLEEVDKGYMMHDKILRHARVIVSADSPDAGTAKGTDGEESQA